MALYEGSRYSNVLAVREEWKGRTVFGFTTRYLMRFNPKNATRHIYKQNERLDILAYQYYGDHQLWWVILDANPSYMKAEDIKHGDVLFIPPYEEVRRIVEQNE